MWIQYLFILMLCIISLIVSQLPRYRAAGNELLKNTDFSQSLNGWIVHGDNKSLVTNRDGLGIHHDISSRHSELRQCFKSQSLPQHTVLQARLRTEQVKSGPEIWNLAKVSLVGYDDQKEALYQFPTVLVGLEGNQGWEHYEKVFPTQQVAAETCVIIALYTSPGHFYVSDISLKGAKSQTKVEYGRQVLLAVWIIVLSWIVISLVRNHQWSFRDSILLLLVFAIAVGVLLPVEIKRSIELEVQSVLIALGFSPLLSWEGEKTDLLSLWPKQMDISKFGHLIGFSLLSTVFFSERDTRMNIVFAGLVLLALASETLQIFVIGRTPRLADFSVDIAGILLGWITGRSVILLVHGRT